MNEIYGVFTEQDSNWKAVAFFTDLSDAEIYCTLKNNFIKDNLTKYYVFEVENKVSERLLNTEVKNYFTIVYIFKNNDFELYNVTYEKYFGEEKEVKVGHSPNILFYVSCDADNKDQAIEISYNYLKEYKRLLSCLTDVEEIERTLNLERL